MKLQLVGLLLLVSAPQGRAEEAEDYEAFTDFIITYNRNYSTAEEFQKRLAIFAENKAWVDAHNNGSHSWQAELNEFSDLSWAEFSAKLKADQVCVSTQQTPKTVKGPLPDPPPSVDWRTKGVVSPVKSQGLCGSCWAFSATGCLESMTAIKTGKLVPLSEQQLIDCSTNFNNHGCKGGSPSQAFESVMYQGGLDSEQSYLYKAKTETCTFSNATVAATVASVVNITQDDEDQLEQAVANVGPVSVSFHIAIGFQFYRGGVYYSKKCPQTPEETDHAVLAVGYDHDASSDMDYWIIKNSWGTKWGLDGYFWLQRGANMCGVAACASYAVVR